MLDRLRFLAKRGRCLPNPIVNVTLVGKQVFCLAKVFGRLQSRFKAIEGFLSTSHRQRPLSKKQLRACILAKRQAFSAFPWLEPACLQQAQCLLVAANLVVEGAEFKGEVVAYAGRFPGDSGEDVPKYKLPQGFRKSQELFNIDRAIKEPADKPLVIVEGFFDAIKLHQNGYKKVVALMGSTLSAAQEELIREHIDSTGKVIVMLDENEAGQAGRDDIACRLAKHCFVRVYVFDKPDMEPEHLTAEDVRQLLGGGV